MPLFSESQAGYLHPLKYLLYPWMETWKAFNYDTILSIWLTGAGTYGWLRRRVSPAAALTGGNPAPRRAVFRTRRRGGNRTCWS